MFSAEKEQHIFTSIIFGIDIDSQKKRKLKK